MKLNNPLYQSFVSPWISQELVEVGLNAITPFTWKMQDGVALLDSVAFDVDCYYLGARKLITHVNGEKVVPAFQMMDMQKLLPDYLLSKTNGLYELSCSKIFQFEIETGDRLADVFAKMVRKAITGYKIGIPESILKITERI